MSIDNAYKLITQRVDVVRGNIIQDKLAQGSTVKGFWGLNYPNCSKARHPLGSVRFLLDVLKEIINHEDPAHIGYLLPCLKLAEFVAAGVETTVYFADTYAFLINHDVEVKQVGYRTRYYRFLLAAVLKSLELPVDAVRFVTESEAFSFHPPFIMNEHRLCAMASQESVRATGSEVSQASVMSPLLCPGRQALAEAHLGVDFQLGGEDQRGLFEFCAQYLPRLGFHPRAHLVNPLLPSLTGAKMSSSAAATTKVEFLDSAETVNSKIQLAEDDGLLSLIEYIVLPAMHIRNTKTGLSCIQQDGKRHRYYTLDKIKADLIAGFLQLDTLKVAVGTALNDILDPVRDAYAANPEWQEMERLGYLA